MTAELLSLVPFELPDPVDAAEHRQALARRAAWRLEDAPAEVIIRWATRTFGSRLALTSSMADAVLIDLFAKHAPGTDVVFLDTGYHFPETIGMRDAVEATYRGRLSVVTVRPEQSVCARSRRSTPPSRRTTRGPAACAATSRSRAPSRRSSTGTAATAR